MYGGWQSGNDGFMTSYAALARFDGFCVGCDDVRSLVVLERGPRGVRAWLDGVGAEDRELSYTCCACGREEHVPQSEDEDIEYDATLPTWPDPTPVVAVPAVPAARPPVVRYIRLPAQRVAATDDQPLARSVV